MENQSRRCLTGAGAHLGCVDKIYDSSYLADGSVNFTAVAEAWPPFSHMNERGYADKKMDKCHQFYDIMMKIMVVLPLLVTLAQILTNNCLAAIQANHAGLTFGFTWCHVKRKKTDYFDRKFRNHVTLLVLFDLIHEGKCYD